VSQKCDTEKRNKITTKIDVARVWEGLVEAEIWIRVRRRYLTSSVGLYFENEPGLTELDAAEGRQNRLSRRIRQSESANLPWSWARRQMAYARFYCHEGIMISTLFASSKFVTNGNRFQVIAETGPTGQLHYDGMANGGHLFRPEEKRRIGLFGTCNALLCTRVNHLNDTEYNHSLPLYSSALIHVSSHLYVASNELRSPGECPAFRFPNGLSYLLLISNCQKITIQWKKHNTENKHEN